MNCAGILEESIRIRRYSRRTVGRPLNRASVITGKSGTGMNRITSPSGALPLGGRWDYCVKAI